MTGTHRTDRQPFSDAGRVVDLARGWIGTPYRHQAAMPGAGADCLGLVRGVWVQLFGQEPEPCPAYTADWSEPSGDEVLWRAAMRHLVPISRQVIAPGDVLLFRLRAGSVAKHLGIAATYDGTASLIHAYSGHGVIESPLGHPWTRRIVARFAYPERGD